jgi:hypothetical protein
MRTPIARVIVLSIVGVLAGCQQFTKPADHSASTQPGANYVFVKGYPTPETVKKAYDDAGLNRAIEAYKFFFPTVAMFAAWKGNLSSEQSPNTSFLLMLGGRRQTVLTPNSDTPYTGALLDLSGGLMVVEIPPGPLIGVVNDLNQKYVMDLGIPGPDHGKGGKHLILPPGYEGKIPAGYFVGRSSTIRVLLMLRAIPPEGSVDAAIALLKTPTFHRLGDDGAERPRWIEVEDPHEQFTAFDWENNLDYWKELHEIIESEPPYEPYHVMYGELAPLGIEKGKPFTPDARMTAILEKAAKIANAQMRVQSFADRTPERLAWPDRHWGPEHDMWDLPNYRNLEVREKWFLQAAIASPAMFRGDSDAGSLYWLGARDNTGAFLDGGKTYRLTVPLPVPDKLSWSITVYDVENRSEIVTDQGKAALRSLFEVKDKTGPSVDLYFGPKAPSGHEGEWIKTIPGNGWFAYFRIYGPEQHAFDGRWKPGDFVEIK